MPTRLPEPKVDTLWPVVERAHGQREPGRPGPAQSTNQCDRRTARFYADDVQREHDRMKAAGAEFTMPPTKVTGSTIAMAKDGCGNLIQIVTLDRRQ